MMDTTENSQQKPQTGLSRLEGEISRRELLKQLSPFGKVKLDTIKCTGCGLCALECPSGALIIIGEETDTFQLLFRHTFCVACGQCAEVCPEQCLHLERAMELDALNHPATVLFETEIVRCSGCSSPIGPKAMIDKLQARVVTARHSFPSQPELCPTCKVQAQFGQLRM